MIISYAQLVKYRGETPLQALIKSLLVYEGVKCAEPVQHPNMGAPWAYSDVYILIDYLNATRGDIIKINRIARQYHLCTLKYPTNEWDYF